MKTKSKLEEKKLSKAELEAREKVIKDLKKNKSALVKRYGKDAEAVMYGRATNIAKKMAESENKNRIKELIRKSLMQEADIEVMADKYGEEQSLGQASMMLDALEELLKKHDWWYMMSDDNRAYTKGSAQQYEIRKIMKELEDMGYSKDAKTLFNKYAPKGPGSSTLKLKEVTIASDMTTQEASGHAERFAKYMSDKEGKTFTVTAGSVDGPSFDLDLDGEKYEGGSYIISTAGEILNMSLPEHPVYANTTMLEGKKEDMDKDGDIDSKDYLLKRDAAIKKAKGEMKEAEKPSMFVTGGNINPELRKKVEQFVKGVAKYYDYSVDDAFLAIMSILKGGLAKEGVNEDLDLGHQDNEPHMIKGELYRIGKYAMELYQMVDGFEGQGEVDFPAWWQSKITTSMNNMVSAKHYLDFETKEPTIDAMVGVASDEEVIDEKKLTPAEKKKKEEIVKGMKDSFKGDKEAMYAIATDKAKKVAETIAKKLKSK
jgi:hypothetical protein